MNSVKMSTAGSGGWTPPTVQEAARLFQNYEVLALLGRGGMGAVYQARQTALDRLVAIKLLPLEVSVDRDFADRFRREARAMAKLNHPNIISVFDFGQTSEGHLYFVMEFVDGAMLHTLIHGPAPIQPAEALILLEQVCDALAYAHGKGIVHRDIKPANVMVEREGRVAFAQAGDRETCAIALRAVALEPNSRKRRNGSAFKPRRIKAATRGWSNGIKNPAHLLFGRRQKSVKDDFQPRMVTNLHEYLKFSGSKSFVFIRSIRGHRNEGPAYPINWPENLNYRSKKRV